MILALLFSSQGLRAQNLTPAAPSKARVLRVAISNAVHSLDLAYAQTTPELIVLSNMVDPLLRRDPGTGTLLPKAAERFEWNAEGGRITFVLRPDLRWSDGKKLGAQDYVLALRRLISPATRSWLSEKLRLIKGAAQYSEGAVMDPAQLGIAALDEKTLAIDLVRPSASFLEVFCEPGTAPLPQENLERFPQAWDEPKNFVGSGPFLLSERREGFVGLRRNPYHRWASQMGLEEVHFVLVEAPREGVDLYLSNRVELFGHRDMSVPTSLLPGLASRRDLLFQPDLRTYFLRVNSSRPPLSLLEVRQAMAMAMDRNLLISSVAVDGETAAFSLIPPAVGRYEPPRGYLYGVSGANRLLQDLGYCDRKKALASCRPLAISTLIYPESAKKQKVALVLQAMMKRNLGLENLEIVARSREDFLKDLRDGNYALALDDVAVLPDQVFGILDAFREDRYSLGSMSKKELVNLLEDAEKSLDWFRRKSLLRRAEAMILQEASIIPLFHGSTIVLVSPRIKGFVPNPWDEHPFSALALVP